MVDADYLIAKGETLIRLARRTADPELAHELDALAHELMAKAVEIDTAREKSESARRSPSPRKRRA